MGDGAPDAVPCIVIVFAMGINNTGKRSETNWLRLPPRHILQKAPTRPLSDSVCALKRNLGSQSWSKRVRRTPKIAIEVVPVTRCYRGPCASVTWYNRMPIARLKVATLNLSLHSQSRPSSAWCTVLYTVSADVCHALRRRHIDWPCPDHIVLCIEGLASKWIEARTGTSQMLRY